MKSPSQPMPLNKEVQRNAIQQETLPCSPDSAQDRWMATRRLFLEAQIRRAWRDLWSLIRHQVPGAIFTLVVAFVSVPIVAHFAHLNMGREILITLATYLVGPVVVFVLAFGLFFFLAPGRLHSDALTDAHHLEKIEPFSFNRYAATIITAFFLATLVVAGAIWLEEHLRARSFEGSLGKEAGAFMKEQAAVVYWKEQASKKPAPAAPKEPASPPPLAPLRPARPRAMTAPTTPPSPNADGNYIRDKAGSPRY
jgi:heme/copper-type cytochrome/quinol oxidase subunit 4